MSHKHSSKIGKHRAHVESIAVKVPKSDAKDVRITGTFCDWDPQGRVLIRDGHGV